MKEIPFLFIRRVEATKVAIWFATSNKIKKVKAALFFIISPTPFYGIGIIESFLKRFIYPLRSFGVPVQYNFDFEAWKYNGEGGFTNFLKLITKWSIY